MISLIFPLLLCGVLFVMFYFGFRILPEERWQIFASIPVKKMDNGIWRGVNITYYGIILSTGYVIAMSLFILLAASAGETWISICSITAGIMLLFVPAAKIMAYIVEGRRNTITVGGASFVMFIASPWIIRIYNSIETEGSAGGNETVILAAVVTAYALGEGIGRLACISFGCCYGRPVNELPHFLRKIFSAWSFTFSGDTKKISYHDHLEGREVVPVQGMTAVLYTFTASLSVYHFLEGNFITSFFISLSVTQLWRFLSEFLRADYRGGTRISVYQVMSLLLVPYFTVYMILHNSQSSVSPDLMKGVQFLWDPLLLIILGAMWGGSLLYTGISSVTAAEISLYVVSDRI